MPACHPIPRLGASFERARQGPLGHRRASQSFHEIELRQRVQELLGIRPSSFHVSSPVEDGLDLVEAVSEAAKDVFRERDREVRIRSEEIGQ